MKMLYVAVALLALLAVAVPAFAQVQDPGIQRRERLQQLRIRQGWRQGQLTPGQVWRLRRGEARIRRMEARMKARGPLSAAQRIRLHRALDRESLAIYRARHAGL